MLIKSFEPRLGAAPEVFFRGRSSYYWKKWLFKIPGANDGHSQDLKSLGTEEFQFILIFDPQRFLAGPSGMIDEIIAYISQCNPGKELILSLEKTPFFAISAASFQKLKLHLEEERTLIDKLRNNGNVRMIPLKHTDGYAVLDMKKDLQAIEKTIVNYQVSAYIANGVIIEDMGNFFIEGMIPIGSGSTISSGVVIKGESKIGADVRIYPHCYIENSTLADHCVLLAGCIVTDSALEENVQIGPYTHLRNHALVKKDAKMGNFVEMKKSVLGQRSKAMHLTYIGDAEVGEQVNIGAGTITCNYDGVNKNKTTIEDGVFIGSGTELVAPVTLRKNSYVGAGSTITEEVPENALAVARQKQRNIVEWVTRKKKKKVCTP